MTDTDPDTTHDSTDPTTSSEDDIEVVDVQRHRNGDETAVLLCNFAGGYQALAMDVDAGGQLLELEEIGEDQDRQTAMGMVQYWLQQHPDGVLGAVDTDDQGLLDRLFNRGEMA